MISKKGLSRKGSSCPYIYWKTARRRGFFILFLRRHDRFDDAGGDFVSVCTLAVAFFHLAGVHFSSHFSAGLAVLTLAAGNLSPFALWTPAFLHLAGVHFSSHFSAPLILSTMPAGNLSPFARWAPAFLHLTGVHFSSRRINSSRLSVQKSVLMCLFSVIR